MLDLLVNAVVPILLSFIATAGVIYKTRADAGIQRHRVELDTLARVVSEYRGLLDEYKERLQQAETNIADLKQELRAVRVSLEAEIAQRDEYIRQLTAWATAVVEIVRRNGISIPEIPRSDLEI